MRSMKTAMLAIAAATLMGVLPGCGSNRDSAGESQSGTTAPVDTAGRTYVGADKCISCHAGFSWSVDAVADYLVGKHVIHSTHVDASMKADGCLVCHDPIGNGRSLEDLIDPADVPAAGLAAVTCEECHGAGGEHYGVGPIPDATPNYDVCGNCHNDDFFHNDHHAEADHIVEDYKTSPHYTKSVRNNPKCVKCHTDEGGRQYRDVSTWEALAATLPIEGGANKIQCRTCHNAHNPLELLKGEQSSHSVVTASAEYATCTNCHQRHDAQVTTDPDPLGGTTDGASGDLIYHAKRWTRVISSTHYDNTATNDADGNELLEGYVMNPANEHVCRDCHNVHSADITINEQWARSGHGGELLEAKEEAIAPFEALDTDDTFDAILAVRAAGSESSWAGHGWPNDGEADCQRCHTATGGKNFITDSATYATAMAAFLDDPDNNDNPNDFSYLAKNDDGDYVQQEMLFCWACHKDNSGNLEIQDNVNLIDRNNDIFATIPAVGKSTVCVGCHAGRANGDYYETVDAADRSSSSRVHHLPAAATLFSAQTHTGYEFDTLDYTDKSYFAHKTIGINNDDPETGDGPCASCHMPEANHSLKAVTVDGGGVITAINNQALCTTCHGDSMTPAELEEQKTGFADALLVMQGYVQNTITNNLDLNLDNSTNLKTAPVTLAYYGVEQNYKFLAEDAGAYVHNRYYAKRLIFDAIDWLQDGDLDTTIDLTGHDAAYEYLVSRDHVTGLPVAGESIDAMHRP